MKKSLVILFVAFVAVASAARLPENDSKLSLEKFDPIVKQILEHFNKIKSEKVIQTKEIDESEEEFRQKPMNLPALLKKVESIEEEQQKVAAEPVDNEDEEDSDVIVSYGLERPIKLADVKKEEKEVEDDEDEDEDTDVPKKIAEEAIDMTNEDDSEVQISYGLAQPILVANLKNFVDKEDDEDHDENESIIPFRQVKEDEEESDDDVEISYGLAEPIPFALQKTIQEVVDDDDDEEEDEDDKPSDVNEKIMSEIIAGAIKKFAKVHGLKL